MLCDGKVKTDSDRLLLHVYDIMKAMSLTLEAFLFCDLNGDMAVYVYSACIFAPGCFVSLLIKL